MGQIGCAGFFLLTLFSQVALAQTQLHSLPIQAIVSSKNPMLSQHANHSPILSWIEPADSKNPELYTLRFALFNGVAWQPAKTAAQGTNWFINWADRAWVSYQHNGNLVAQWLVKSSASPYAYQIYLSFSNDDGLTWSKPIIPHTDRSNIQHGFSHFISDDSGLLTLFWIEASNNDAALKSRQVDAQGQWADEQTLDSTTCSCCQIDAALSRLGMALVYRNRTKQEIRDISVIRQQDTQWSNPKIIAADNWHIAGCPVNGPAIDALDSQIAVAWFTAANDTPTIRVAFSSNSGASFERIYRLSSENVIGRVDVVMLSDGSAFVSWLASGNLGPEIRLAHVYPNGDGQYLNHRLASAAYFSTPKMVKHKDKLLFSWQDDKQSLRLKSGWLALPLDF